MIEYFMSHGHLILLLVVLMNQLLADIPALKGNTVFTLFRGFVKSEAKKVEADLEKTVSDLVK